jgi:quercetin dioxygenase-like cupin family protein
MTDLSIDHSRAIEDLEGRMLREEQVGCPVTHHFAPGVYVRECRMPAGSIVVGHMHSTDHASIMVAGKARVLVDGQVRQLVAPCVVHAKANTRKVAYIEEDVVWMNVHPTDETNIEQLEAMLIVKSETFLQHELEIQQALQQLNQSTSN